jgi:predicted transcriptional regulator
MRNSRMAMTSIRMPDDLAERLEQTARLMRRAKGWVINEAVREYVEREEQRQQMLRETQEGLADIDAGRVVDGEAVMAWLESWGTDHELEPPKP